LGARPRNCQGTGRGPQSKDRMYINRVKRAKKGRGRGWVLGVWTKGVRTKEAKEKGPPRQKGGERKNGKVKKAKE